MSKWVSEWVSVFCFGAFLHFSSYIFLFTFVSYISILPALQVFFLFRKQKSTRRGSSSARDAPTSPAVRHVTPRLRQQFGSSSAAVRHVTPRLRQQFGSSSAREKCVTHDQKCVTLIRNALRLSEMRYAWSEMRYAWSAGIRCALRMMRQCMIRRYAWPEMRYDVKIFEN